MLLGVSKLHNSAYAKGRDVDASFDDNDVIGFAGGRPLRPVVETRLAPPGMMSCPLSVHRQES